MTRKNNSKIISVVHPICCGLDVHKDKEKIIKKLKLNARHLGFSLVPADIN